MIREQTTSKTMNVILWIAQMTLAVFLVMGAIMKFMPIDKISGMMPWTGELPLFMVRILGLLDLLGALGLILPSVLRFHFNVTPWAALCIVALMLSAIVFHVLRGEASVIGFNIFLAVAALLVAWGRFREASR